MNNLARLMLASILLAPTSARSDDDPPTSPVTVPGASRFDVTSKAGRPYRIFLYIPDAPAPADGYPVMYALDGNSSFGMLVEFERIQRRMNGPVAIVGVGYPIDGHMDLDRRFLDFTPPTPDELVRRFPGATHTPETGGRDAFLDFLVEELRPIVGRKLKVDEGRQAICGHSLGGLFVLHALFHRPGAFQAYVAASPSIWWNDRSIEAEARAFAAVPADVAPARLLMTFGALEGAAVPGDAAERNEARKQTRMPESVRAMAETLAPLADGGLAVQVAEFPGENHGSVIPAALARGLARSFAKAP
jgi:predicted alpha/beta superfamily hydrolase